MSYFVNFGTGAVNETASTVTEARRIAEEGIAYTGRDIRIEDGCGYSLAVLPWYRTEPKEGEFVTSSFGRQVFMGNGSYYKEGSKG